MENFQIPEELLLPETKCLEDSGLNDAERIAALLELASDNDLEGFQETINADKSLIKKSGSWYGRQSGSRQMILVQRTPVMIASLSGSVDVLKFALSFVRSGDIDINQCCEPDGFSALHCSLSGGSSRVLEVVSLLIQHGADVNILDKERRRPLDVISPKISNLKESLENLMQSSSTPSIPTIKTLQTETSFDSTLSLSSSSEPPLDSTPSSPTPSDNSNKSSSSLTEGNLVECTVNAGKEYPTDPSLPDIKNAVYMTDEFRMFSFKIRPCSRAYSHDWTECPFVHPGENARRRDPRRFHYSCVPCPDFRKGSCRRGDSCEYAHGVFECWLHPAQYRTRLCKDGPGCSRRVCFFAHLPEELRPLYSPNGCSLPSRSSAPIDMRSLAISPDLPPPSPSSVLIMSPFSPSPGGSPSANLTPPMSPSHASNPPLPHSNIWSNGGSAKAPPTLQLSSGLHASRLRAALHARDMTVQEEMDNMLLMQVNELEDSAMASDSSLLNAAAVSSQSRFLTSNAMNGHGDSIHGRSLSCHSLNSIQDYGEDYPSEVLLSPRSSVRSSRSPFMNASVHPHLDHVSPSHIRQRSEQLLQSNLDFSPPMANSILHSNMNMNMNMNTNTNDVLNSSNVIQAQQSAVVAALNARRNLSSRSSSWRDREPCPSLLSSNSVHGQPPMAGNYSMVAKNEWGMNHQKEGFNMFVNNLPLDNVQSGTDAEPDVSWVQSLVKDGISDSVSSSSPDAAFPSYHPDPSLDMMRMSLNSSRAWSE